MIKINLYGGPSCGKSTLSTLLFAELKLRTLNTELVREFAKELVYQDYDMHNLREADRIFILAEQMRRESILHGKVDYLITDSPVMIAAYYYNKRPAIDLAKELMKNLDHSGAEFHFYILRDEDAHFEQYGRAHSEDESRKIDKDMIEFLRNEGMTVHVIQGNPVDRLKKIMNAIGLSDELIIDIKKSPTK